MRYHNLIIFEAEFNNFSNFSNVHHDQCDRGDCRSRTPRRYICRLTSASVSLLNERSWSCSFDLITPNFNVNTCGLKWWRSRKSCTVRFFLYLAGSIWISVLPIGSWKQSSFFSRGMWLGDAVSGIPTGVICTWYNSTYCIVHIFGVFNSLKSCLRESSKFFSPAHLHLLYGALRNDRKNHLLLYGTFEENG